MKKMSANEIRQTWLNFFKSKGHHIEPGSSLIPKNDPTLLWINAGVAALKKYFDGTEVPPSRRISNVQKSIRTNDIENVGHTARHHTFFEMLGNFSIGDYFRDDAIDFASELLFSEQYFGFPREKIYITYHPDDLDTKKCWMKNGVQEDHLIPQEENFWEIGEGPCGPDTEMFFDRGEKYDPEHLGIKLLKEDIENDRYIEIWNIVFSQFNSVEGVARKNYKELPNKNIDTGAGLERFACILQDTDTNFETDLFWPIILEIEKLSHHKYSENTLSFRVIADHIRAITFAISDGEMFSNESRGYVLRRLLRRAERHGRKLGINEPFLYKLVGIVVDIMKDFYPYLVGKQAFVEKAVLLEEEKFIKTLAVGENLLMKLIIGKDVLSSEDMFRLYDTYGFPQELTKEICEENNVKVDEEGFKVLMNQQKERARNARGELQSMNKQSKDLLEFMKNSVFDYDDESKDFEAVVIGLFKNKECVSLLEDEGEIILNETNFYAESGGQIADIGTFSWDDGEGTIGNVIKAPNKQHLHFVKIQKGTLKEGDKVTLHLNVNRRERIRRNHSSVHLLQSALTEVLGDHIAQQGSFVSDEYARFDFNHFQKLTKEQIDEIEAKVNFWIFENISCETKILPIEEARNIGAKALFDEKYGDVVRVVCFGEVSKEFCGGTHVRNTGEIGLFKIESEESIASGIRRIQSCTSIGAYDLIKKEEKLLANIADSLGVLSPWEIMPKIDSSNEEKRNLKIENEKLQQRIALSQKEAIVNKIQNINGISVLIEFLKNTKRQDLLNTIDLLKQNNKKYLFVLLGEENGNIPVVVAADEQVNSFGLFAGNIVKDITNILGGSGGGRKDFASGAGKNKDKIQEALDYAKGLCK